MENHPQPLVDDQTNSLKQVAKGLEFYRENNPASPKKIPDQLFSQPVDSCGIFNV